MRGWVSVCKYAFAREVDAGAGLDAGALETAAPPDRQARTRSKGLWPLFRIIIGAGGSGRLGPGRLRTREALEPGLSC